MQALIQFAFVQHDADPSQFPPELCLLFEFNKARVSDPEYVEYVRGRLFDTFASTGNKSNDVHVYLTWRDFDPEAVGISQIWPESPWHLFSSEYRASFENRLDADDNNFSMCVGKYFPEHGCHLVQVRVTKTCSGDVPTTVSVGVIDEDLGKSKESEEGKSIDTLSCSGSGPRTLGPSFEVGLVKENTVLRHCFALPCDTSKKNHLYEGKPKVFLFRAMANDINCQHEFKASLNYAA
eukprot:gene9244-16394_t